MAEHIKDKAASLKGLADELVSFVEKSLATARGATTLEQATALETTAPGATASAVTQRRFDCGDYTCHGHFTCSSFGCGSSFKLAD